MNTACQVDNCQSVERALHTALDLYKVRPKKESFEIEPEQAVAILKIFGSDDMTSTADNEIKSDMTKTGIEAGEKYKKKRPSLNFERMGIPSGSILEFNDDEITAEALVTSARRVSMRMLIFH